MRWPNPLLLLILGSLGSLAAAEEAPCTIHDNGKYYDLNPLKASKDYEFKTPDGNMFVLNVCRSIWHETFGLKVDKPDEIAGFIRRGHGDFSIGAINTTLSIRDSRPRLTLSNGSKCKSSSGEDTQTQASAVVEFVCDTSVFSAGTPRLIAQLPDDEVTGCAFVIEWKTHYACPTSEKGGAWGLFAVLAMMSLIFLMLYTVLGTLYNRYVLQLRGFDQIPQFSFESMKYHGMEAVEWLKDAVNGYSGRNGDPILPGGGRTNPISHQSQAGGVGSNSGGFARPPPRGFSRGSETNPFSHQVQVLSQSERTPPPTPPPKEQSKKKFGSEAQAATREEREFMLGDEDEDEGEEMDIVKTSSPPKPRHPEATNDSGEANTPGGANSDSQHADSSIAAIRGRDMGDEGVIRL